MAGFFDRFFGFSVTKEKANNVAETSREKTFVLPENQDGAYVLQTGGHFGAYIDLDGANHDDVSLINRYREMALTPELDTAITNILDDAIISEDSGKTVEINLDNLKEKESLKNKIKDEFDNVLRLLNFNNNGHEIFRRWYVDGRLFYHMIIDEKRPYDGVKEVRYIDPRRIKKIRQIHKTRDSNTGIDIIRSEQEYYLYNERGMIGAYSNLGVKIKSDSIVYITSGLVDPKKNQVLSYLHKAIKPLNNLRMVEDATVIYRISRAPERRVFYIDVGNMPTQKAEAYLKAQQTRFRNKITYDATTGEIRDEKKHMSMIEDFWLPRREGGKGTEITTLPAGQNLGQIEDVNYFQDKLYKALNIPYSRLKNESGGFSLGRTTEITRDEIAFAKFIQRLRKRFAQLFFEILKRQLLLKNILTEEEFDEFVEYIWFDFIKDNNFEEFRDAELLRERIATLTQIDPYVGRYYSMEWVRKNVLLQTNDEIEEIMNQIEDEKEKGIFVDPMEAQDSNNPMNSPAPADGQFPQSLDDNEKNNYNLQIQSKEDSPFKKRLMDDELDEFEE